MVEQVHGNLLEASTEALVNTVNTVGVMGKGIALQFKKAFPENFKAYEQACKTGEVRPGRMFMFDVGKLQNPRYIINFPTKRHWKGKSKLEDIESGLRALVELVGRLGIKSLAIPPLGCGNGGLDWAVVYPMISRAFEVLPEVRVLVYAPFGAPAAGKMVNRTKRPLMTAGRAAVVGLMSRYGVLGYAMSLLEVQKLVYFLKQAGEPLEQVKFVKGAYGPYADTLRHVLDRMEGHFIQGYGDGENKPTTPIQLMPDAADEVEGFLVGHEATRQRFDRVTALIEGFESPYGMELLSSVHWVASREDSRARMEVEEAIRDVHDWNKRKEHLLRTDHIRTAWQRLREQEWI